MLSCGHYFHEGFLAQWLSHRRTCPLCQRWDSRPVAEQRPPQAAHPIRADAHPLGAPHAPAEERQPIRAVGAAAAAHERDPFAVEGDQPIRVEFGLLDGDHEHGGGAAVDRAAQPSGG